MLFNDHLVPGGHYVIEDICTSFVEGFDDFGPFQAPPTVDSDLSITEFPSHQNGLVGFVKQLMDHAQMGLMTMDLIGPQFDRPASEPAKRTLIICSTPRTGSYEPAAI